MVEITDEDFETLVTAELDALPDNMVEGLDNIIFVIEDLPEDGSTDLLGLYDGLALTERGDYGYGEIPDRITLFKHNLQAHCDDLEHLRDEVRITLVHEIAHHFGIDDERLHELGWA
ncbi:metallopeptidase family protein [Lysinibacter cavernae]|uniref:Putative Zn-dependent protease with MMP-like domain n=1 Tax=Lysinibacter cavernae TaxID=1640652 RepID=A0A7X5TSQ0_9MICO|nr:metallopeptidase family protein [Lysinibacter cavernae]NIH52463.1 putative Zn-dependent protease with MMP-like domain [Lysinibacter cavernae]